MKIEDDGELYSSYERGWAILVENGLKGLSSTVSAIISDKMTISN